MLNLIFSGWECGVWVGLVLFSACLGLTFGVLVSWCFGGFCILVRIMMFGFGVVWNSVKFVTWVSFLCLWAVWDCGFLFGFTFYLPVWYLSVLHVFEVGLEVFGLFTVLSACGFDLMGMVLIVVLGNCLYRCIL